MRSVRLAGISGVCFLHSAIYRRISRISDKKKHCYQSQNKYIKFIILFKKCYAGVSVVCYARVSVVDPDLDSMGSLDPESGTGSRREKMYHKNRKSYVNLIFMK
jgi:hypothetical protein